MRVDGQEEQRIRRRPLRPHTHAHTHTPDWCLLERRPPHDVLQLLLLLLLLLGWADKQAKREMAIICYGLRGYLHRSQTIPSIATTLTSNAARARAHHSRREPNVACRQPLVQTHIAFDVLDSYRLLTASQTLSNQKSANNIAHGWLANSRNQQTHRTTLLVKTNQKCTGWGAVVGWRGQCSHQHQPALHAKTE